MTINEVPKSYEYVCDSCGATHVQKNASGHYHNSTPKNWATILVRRLGETNVDRLLCEGCAEVPLKQLGIGRP